LLPTYLLQLLFLQIDIMAYDPSRLFFRRPFPFDPEFDAARTKVIQNRLETQEAINSNLYDFPSPLKPIKEVNLIKKKTVLAMNHLLMMRSL
jgi:hypothetical protein